MAPFRIGPRTSASLIAGRAIDPLTLTAGTVRAIGELVERESGILGHEVVAHVAGDTTDYDGTPAGDDAPTYNRLVIGLRTLVVDADQGPAGPITRAELAEVLDQATSLFTPLFWRRVMECLPATPALPFSAQELRASAAGTGHPKMYDGVALDRADLLACEDAVHLCASGPLAYAMLAEGERTELIRDENDEVPSDLVWGTDSHQGFHSHAVRGRLLAQVADIQGIGSVRIDLEALTDDARLWVIARYD